MRRVGFLAAGIVLSCAALAMGGTPNLLHRYSFNDGTADDSVGGANGILVNGATISNGMVVFDPAVNDGTNAYPPIGQYVYLPQSYPLTRALTLELWATYRGGYSWQRLVDFGNCTGGVLLPTDKTTVNYTGSGFLTLSQAGSVVGQIIYDWSWGGAPSPFDNWISAGIGLPLNQEFQVVYTHDPDAGLAYLYLNGTEIASAPATADPSLTNYSNHFLGRSNFSWDPFYNGTIDEFRYYEGALTAAQVSADYAAGPDVVTVPEPSGISGIGLALWLCRRRRTR